MKPICSAMLRNLLPLFLASGAVAADIVLSKDSLKIWNNPVSSFIDEIRLKNQTAATVDLDSAFLHIDEMDTAGSGPYGGLGDRFKIRWKRTDPVRYDMWSLGTVTANTYRLTPSSSSSSIRPSLHFSAPGESLVVAFVEIGTCLGCSGVPTWYPPYFKGSLLLYFDNAQKLEIRLYSEDLRKKPAVDEPCGDLRCDTMNVRKILERNGIESVPMSNVVIVGNGRVTTLQFSYNPAAAVSLPKPIRILPAEIGNLTGLMSIMAHGNSIDSISPRIGRCSSLTGIYGSNNGITVLPDSLIRCTNLQNIDLEGNKIARLPDSIGKMKNIKYLTVTNNLLTSLPASIALLDSIKCIFIAENRICSLPPTVEAWLGKVRDKMYCEQFDPKWPESQECGGTSVGPASRKTETTMNTGVVYAGSLLTVETGISNRADCSVKLSDIAGRMARQSTVVSARSGATIRLSTIGLSSGVYFITVVSDGRIVCGRPILIGK